MELLERGADTAHLRRRGIDVSIFVLDRSAEFVEERRVGDLRVPPARRLQIQSRRVAVATTR